MTDNSDRQYLVKGEHCHPFNWIVRARTKEEAIEEMGLLIDQEFFGLQYTIKILSVSEVE